MNPFSAYSFANNRFARVRPLGPLVWPAEGQLETIDLAAGGTV
jgi:hypothetical protein